MRDSVKKIVPEQRKISHQFHEEFEDLSSQHKECKKYKLDNDKLFQSFADDLQCCVDSGITLMSRALRLKLQSTALNVASRVVADASVASFDCDRGPSNCDPTGFCKAPVSSMATADKETLQGSINHFDGLAKSGLGGAVINTLDCLDIAVLTFKFNFVELKTKVYDCISDSFVSHSDSS